MTKYIRKSSRITVQYIDSDTDEVICETNNRDQLNIGEIFTTYSTNSILGQKFGTDGNIPKNILVIAISEFTLDE